MPRFMAALVLLIAMAAAARADTSVIISGGGFSFYSGPSGLQRFHHDGGMHWRKSHRHGGSFLFHRLPRHDHMLLSVPHRQGWIARRKLRSWDQGHAHGFRRHVRPQVVIIVPGAFDSRIEIVTVPGRPCFGTLFDRRTGHSRLVLLPPVKPGALPQFD
jgi:hypothetical protein